MNAIPVRYSRITDVVGATVGCTGLVGTVIAGFASPEGAHAVNDLITTGAEVTGAGLAIFLFGRAAQAIVNHVKTPAQKQPAAAASPPESNLKGRLPTTPDYAAAKARRTPPVQYRVR
ncbi:MAG: hypothetical protein WDO70_02435 [Alphaproteobacteria bacterium]